MAATGYTPILIYASGTATNVPLAANLTSGASGAELALNYADGKLYFKDSGGVVQLLASQAGASGSVTSVNVSGGTTGLTTSGGPVTTSGTITLAGTLNVANGGTGAASLTANNVLLGNGTSALQVVAPGTNGNILTSNGTTWVSSAPATSGTVTSVALSGGTTGLTVSGSPITTSGTITLSGTLSPANGGTGVANNSANTLTFSGAYGLTLTLTNTTSITLPTTGTLATLAGSETLTNKTVTNPTVTNYTESVVAIGNSGTSQTLSLTSGTVQTVTLTGNCTFTMPTATAGKSFILIVVQDGTGGRTATFTSVKWPNGTAPTITTTATTGRDILTFVADGTNWYGTYAQNFS